VQFCLLGPLLVRCGGDLVLIPPGKQRVVLAVLLLNRGRVVSLDELAETLWETGPPPSARVTVQNYVKRLRRALGDAGFDRIATRPGGYLIRVDDGELDVSRFEALLGAARAGARDGSWEQAARHAGGALELWRGEPLADVDSEVLAAQEVPRLAELRLQALEARIDAYVRLGRHGEVIAELQVLTVHHPLREHLYALLMLALYLDGRQGETLAVYHQARRVLLDELGVEPGDELRELHRRVLAHDPLLALPAARYQEAAASGPAAARTADVSRQRPAGTSGPAHIRTSKPGAVVPRQLPAAVRHFTGRQHELEVLNGLLNRSNAADGTVIISAIAGTAGVGKTTLAVHWAHQVAGDFPDGSCM
jgi:DNA-binding SARP family transcriptional activator